MATTPRGVAARRVCPSLTEGSRVARHCPTPPRTGAPTVALGLLLSATAVVVLLLMLLVGGFASARGSKATCVCSNPNTAAGMLRNTVLFTYPTHSAAGRFPRWKKQSYVEHSYLVRMPHLLQGLVLMHPPRRPRNYPPSRGASALEAANADERSPIVASARAANYVHTLTPLLTL